MATAVKKKKITTIHPRTSSRLNIAAEIYEPFKAAIIQSLKGSKGKTFTALTKDVAKIIKNKMPFFKGSVAWYTISIRLDLETRGIVETFTEKGKKLNRLASPASKGEKKIQL
jgi:hypothetical protein